MKTVFSTLSSSLIFIFLFFFGLDNFILFQRTFSQEEYFTTSNYIHYFLSNIVVWLSGFIFFKKVVAKYNINSMIMFSLLISAFTSWAQYRIGQQSIHESFNSNIIINLLFNFNMSFLTTSVAHYIKIKSSIENFRKKLLYSASSIILGLAIYPIFTQNQLGDYFIMTSVFYIIGFFLWSFIANTDEDAQNNQEKSYTSIAFLLCITALLAGSLILHTTGSKEIKNTFDNLSILSLFLFMTIFMKIINKFRFKNKEKTQ